MIEDLKAKSQAQGRAQSPEQFYSRMSPEQIGNMYNTSFQLPKHPTDALRDGDRNPWEKPEDWDYQTAEFGWNGEALPDKAVGWKPDGTPWYGGENEWDEWKKSVLSKINAPAERAGEDYWEDAKAGFKGKGFMSKLGGLMNAFQALGNYKMKGGETPTGLAKTSRGIGQGIMGLGIGLGQVAKWAETTIFSRLQGLEDIAEAGGVADPFDDKRAEKTAEKVGSWIGEWGKNIDWWDTDVVGRHASSAMKGLANLADVILPWQVVSNAIRASVAPLSKEEKRNIMDERVQSSKILYSTFVEPALKEQYLSRVAEGEHPYLVQLDLENPVAEGLGQAILDPLNVIGLIAKGTKAVGAVSNFQDYMGKPIGRLQEFFGVASKSGLQNFDEATDLTRVAERLIEVRGEYVGKLADASVDLNVRGQGPLGFIRPTVNKALQRSGIFAWSNPGKQHHLQRLTNDMMQIITKSVGKEPEEALDIIHHLILMQSDNVDEVTEALAYLGGSKMPMNVVTSEAGMRFGATFREMLTDADGVVDITKFRDSLKELESAEEIMEFFSKKTAKVAEKLFPSLEKRQSIINKIANNEDLSAMEKLIGARPLKGGEKVLVKLEAVKDNKFLKGVNGFFSGVYMGMSPGYAMRNLFTNEFHLLMDLGKTGYARGWKRITNGGLKAHLDDVTNGMTGQFADIGIGAGGQEAGKVAGKKLPFTALAGKFETNAGLRAYTVTYKDSLNKLIPVIMEDITPALRQAGLTDDQIKLYGKVLKRNYGKFAEANQMILDAVQTGTRSIFETGEWIPDEMLDVFEHLDLDNDILSIIRNATGLTDSKEMVIRELKRVYQDVVDYMKTTEQTFAHIEIDDLLQDGLEFTDDVLRKLEDVVDLGDEQRILSAHSQQANRIAERYTITALRNDIRLAHNQGIDVFEAIQRYGEEINDPKIVQMLDDLMNERFFDGVHDDWNQKIFQPLNTWSKRIKGGYKNKSVDEVIELAWKELGHLVGGGPAPKNLSGEQFNDLLWNVIMPAETRAQYNPVRDAHAIASELLHTILEKEGAVFDESAMGFWKEAKKALIQAKAYDTHVIRNVDYDELGRAVGGYMKNLTLKSDAYNDYMDIQKLAYLNGIPTGVKVTEDGKAIMNNHLLNKINKTLGDLGIAPYNHLDEVPWEHGELAIRQMRGKDFNGITRAIPKTKIDIPEAFTTVISEANLYDSAVPTSQMDQRLGKLMKAWAYQMSFELDVVKAERGQRRLKYPDWFRELDGAKLTYKGKRGGQAIVNALLDLSDGKDGDEAIFHTLRHYIARVPIGRQAKQDYLIDPVKDMILEVRQMIKAYAPEPESMIDNLMNLADDIPEEITEAYQYKGRFMLPNDMYRWNTIAGESEDLDEIREILIEITGNEDFAYRIPTARAGREAIGGIMAEIQRGGKVPIPRGAPDLGPNIDDIPVGTLPPSFEGGLPGDILNVEEVQRRFSDAFDEFGFDEADFLKDAMSVPSPQTMTDPHAYLASAPTLNTNFKELLRLVEENYGKVEEVYSNPQLVEAMKDVEKLTAKQETLMRLTANEFASANRNFSLLNYDSRRNIDTLTGLFMPYQFFYGRTVPNWGRRIARNPAILANYARYKQTLEKLHAGMPEFWRQNLNSHELLGLFPKNPLYWNLEATLNPLQGLTGTDFEDPEKRIDGWSRFLDDANRFGPSTNPLFQYITAYVYHVQGEEEASSRWGSRIFPQTHFLKALGSLTGSEVLQKEWDPAIKLFSGGIDPYERRRVGRAFTQLIADGIITPEQALDASFRQEGEVWELARKGAIKDRRGQTISSFLFGVGFKGRKQSDIQNDMMYEEFFALMNQRDRLSSADFKLQMAHLSQKYPFMDTVMTSRKSGWARDMTFAYNVLSRIPPGDNARLFEMAGVDERLVEKFYQSKGEFDGWAESDKDRFMAGIVDMSAVLAIPDNYTKQDWTNARAQWSNMTDQMKLIYGEDIEDKIDHYYALNNSDQEKGRAFLEMNRDVEMAMDWKTAQIVNSPLLAPYYSGRTKIASYNKQVMWDEAERLYGEGIFDIQTTYFELEQNQRKAFLRQHPELKDYWDFREEFGRVINKRIIDMTNNLPEGIPASFRQDIPENVGIGGQDIQSQLYQPEDPLMGLPSEEWYNALGPKNFQAVYQYLESDKSFEYKTKNDLRSTAEQMGISLDDLIQYIGISLQREGQFGQFGE